MKISAQNVIRGKVISLRKSDLLADVTIEVAPDVVIASTVPVVSIEQLGFGEGDEIYAVFDSTAVHVGVPHHKRGE